MNKLTIMIVLGCLILTGIVMGCSSSREYEQPEKLERAEDNVTESKTASAVGTFNIGETASNNKLAVTVNSISFVDKISAGTSDFKMDLEPKEGYKFLILDLTIENLQEDKTEIISSIMQFEIIDSEGYTYKTSFYTVYLDRSWVDGDLLPGLKKRGNNAFEVPVDAEKLKFIFLYDIVGTSAVYALN